LETAVRTNGPTEPIQWTLTNKDGIEVDAVTYFTMFTDTTGSHEIFCMDVNVSALVEAQRRIQDLLTEKEVILKEVHHRIKNNMNTIAGMLWLQADTMKDKSGAQALLDAQGRIMNMMVLYNKLFRSVHFTTLSVKEFIEDMITHIRTSQDPSERIEVTMAIQDAEIDSKKLQTIGMIVNELMSNVYKYAFPLGAEGRVLISMTFPETGILRLEIHDSGKGLPVNVMDGSIEDGSA
jgi:two-component sensor histidine kinase